jgi:putative membrane protein
MKFLSVAVLATVIAPNYSFTQPASQSLVLLLGRSDADRETRLHAGRPTEQDLERFQSYGEASRKFRRSYFGHSDWLNARRDGRYLYNFRTLFSSGVARQLFKEVSIAAYIATFLVVWNALLVVGYDDFSGVHHDPLTSSVLPLLKLPSEPFTLSSPALGLLLVFRTNTSYQRWDEGRKAWGQIINNSRTCVRLGTTWADKEQDGSKEKLHRLADAVWSFPRSLSFHMLGPLEDGAAFAQDVQKLDDKDFARDLLTVRHKPTRSLKEITEVLGTINFKSIVYQAETEKSVTALCDALGACERIFTSPVPVFYTRHTARFLVSWLFLLPLALYAPFDFTWNHWAMIPTSLVISYFLLGIEELAAQMEEPFSILPMEKMTGGIRLSCDEHVDWKDYAEDDYNYGGGRPDSFYQLDTRK